MHSYQHERPIGQHQVQLARNSRAENAVEKRRGIRPKKQLSAENKLQSAYGKNFSIRSFFNAIHETDKMLNDTIDVAAAKEFENRQHEQPRRKAFGRTK